MKTIAISLDKGMKLLLDKRETYEACSGRGRDEVMSPRAKIIVSFRSLVAGYDEGMMVHDVRHTAKARQPRDVSNLTYPPMIDP